MLKILLSGWLVGKHCLTVFMKDFRTLDWTLLENQFINQFKTNSVTGLGTFVCERASTWKFTEDIYQKKKPGVVIKVATYKSVNWFFSPVNGWMVVIRLSYKNLRKTIKLLQFSSKIYL